VRLTGNFGSEVFRGVSTLKPIRLSPTLLVPELRSRLNAIPSDLSLTGPPVTRAAFSDIPWNLFGSLAAARSQVVFRTPYMDNELVALAYRAPVSERRSPEPALRLVGKNSPVLARIPTDRALTLGHRGPMHWLARIIAETTFKLDYLHKEGLPHRLSALDALAVPLSKAGALGRHKYLPYRPWFRRELAPYIAQVLGDSQTARLPYFSSKFLQSAAGDHLSGRRNYIREINAVLTLEAIDRVLIRRPSANAETNITHRALANTN
jgi:asparagine synthase (glutamine-hydrolysing)